MRREPLGAAGFSASHIAESRAPKRRKARRRSGSPAFVSNQLASGQLASGQLASGQLASGQLASGQLASGQLALEVRTGFEPAYNGFASRLLNEETQQKKHFCSVDRSVRGQSNGAKSAFVGRLTNHFGETSEISEYPVMVIARPFAGLMPTTIGAST